MTDYILFIKNNKYYETNNNTKFGYVHLASITKFIVLLGFIDCIEKHNITYNDKIKKVFPKYKYDYTFLDIINHKTKIQNDWTPQSQLQIKYFDSKNIYNYVIKMNINNKLADDFNYSNYTYNILAYTIYKLEHIYIDKYLETSILKDVKYKWYKNKNQPFTSHSLFIHTSTFKIFAKNIWEILKNKNLDFFWNNYKFIVINKKKYYLLGHDGSGGQFLYYNIKLNSILFWFNYTNDDTDRNIENFDDLFIKMFTKL